MGMDNRNQNDKQDNQKLKPGEQGPRKGDVSQDPNKKHGEQDNMPKH